MLVNTYCRTTSRFVSINHWVNPEPSVWRSDFWDPVYPKYQRPIIAKSEPDIAKRIMIQQYVDDYNRRMLSLQEHHPTKVLLVRTKQLLDLQSTLFEFIGLPGIMSEHALNSNGTIEDGMKPIFRF